MRAWMGSAAAERAPMPSQPMASRSRLRHRVVVFRICKKEVTSRGSNGKLLLATLFLTRQESLRVENSFDAVALLFVGAKFGLQSLTNLICIRRIEAVEQGVEFLIGVSEVLWIGKFPGISRQSFRRGTCTSRGWCVAGLSRCGLRIRPRQRGCSPTAGSSRSSLGCRAHQDDFGNFPLRLGILATGVYDQVILLGQQRLQSLRERLVFD